MAHTDRNMALASLNTTLEQLTKKKDIIGELDAKIAAEIKDPKELEAEIFESDEINYDIEENISQIRKYIEISSLSSHTQELSHLSTASSNPQQNTTQETLQENTTQEPSQEPMYEHPQQVASQQVSTLEASPAPQQVSTLEVSPAPQQVSTLEASPSQQQVSTLEVSPAQQQVSTLEASPVQQQVSTLEASTAQQQVSTLEASPAQQVSTPEVPPAVEQIAANQVSPSSSNFTHTTQNISRLPKLSLPTFNGNSLHWQTFWDSFDAAVHSNTNLTGVQKFSYLKAQISGDAARAISGFTLTNTNYEQAIILLKERFGQSYNIVNAHMQALLNIPKPSTNLISLRQFYDNIENHIRGLSALGKSEESLGSLLTPVILGKLPVELQRNLAREQNNSEWTINLLRQAILKEVTILEVAVPIDDPLRTFNEHNSPSMTVSFHTTAHGS